MIILAKAFYNLTEILIWSIIIRSFVLMIIRDQNNPILRLLCLITDPILIPIKNVMYKIRGNPIMLDFSPLIAIILINIIRSIVLSLLV